MRTPNCSNLKELLQQRASSRPDHVVYSFLKEDLSVGSQVNLGYLDLRARAVAGFLQSATRPGDRILLVFPFGPEFLEGFWGAIYAGRIPVPAHAPRPGRNNHTLKAICNDAKPAIALTSRGLLSGIQQVLGGNSAPAEMQCLCVEDILNDAAETWNEPQITPGTTAFLQYTSGSTATPRGVIVSHGNIVRNEQMIQEAFGEDESSVVVSWLPLYHDMGLIGAVLQPLWTGGRCFLMSPKTFIQDPSQWLRAVSRFQATTSGGPDFAYRLCTARISGEQLAGTDLRAWKTAFNGSEPVRAETLRRFTAKFEPFGFQKSAFVPCYGLAESTLLVTAARHGSGPMLRHFQGGELERNQAVGCDESDPGSRTLVGCGAGDSRQDVEIVNPETGLVCAAGEIGEIQVSGPHVTQGYWNKKDETAEIFGRKVAGKDGFYLRTGDLGFRLDGELFITGRIRDLIVLRGRNFYPQDFELLATEAREAFQAGLAAAFVVDTEAEPELVLLVETQNRALDFEPACQAIREAIVGEYDVSPGRIVLVRFGTLDRTSSGKIRRRQCREKFLAGGLAVVFDEWAGRGPAQLSVPQNDAAGAASPLQEPSLPGIVRRILRLGGQELDPELSLFALGMDSIAAAELRSAIAHELKADVPLETILQGINLLELSKLVDEKRQVDSSADTATASPSAATYPLSQVQMGIWYLSRLSPESAAYNISVAMECEREIGEELLRESFAVLMRRHAALRTVIRTSHEGPHQLVLDEMDLSFTVEDAEDLPETVFQDLLSEAAERPFNLEEGPLFRIFVFRTGGVFRTRGEKQVLLFVFHHLIADFLSLEFLLREFGSVYQALAKGEDFVFTTHPPEYQDYIQRQQHMLAGERGEELKRFWHDRLSGELPVTELPFSRVRPAVRTDRGRSCRFQVPASAARSVRERAKELGVSLYSMLLGGFEILIHRYTGRPEITVGSPVSGRLSSRWEQTVGLFMNQIVLRPAFSGETRIADFLRKTHKEVAAGLAHQEYPFSLLVEQLQPRRDPSHSPLFQLMFSFYRARHRAHQGLEAFLLGVPGVELRVEGLEFRSLPVENRTAQLDLNLSIAEVDGELRGNLQWNADLFDAESIAETAAHYTALLEFIAANPETRISEIPMVRPGDSTHLSGPGDPLLQRDPAEPIQNLVMAQAAARPAATALTAVNDSITYAELTGRSESLAAYLRSLGVGPDVPVAIIASRSATLLTGMLGVLFAGGAFVPIDPAIPAERAALMIAESHAPVLLTEEIHLSVLPETAVTVICLDRDIPETDSPRSAAGQVTPQNLAYILFTSGSTGKPKGVMISHGNLTSFCGAMDRQIECGPGDTFFATTSISFDISILELLWPLTRGAEVRLMPEQFRFGGAAHKSGAARRAMEFAVFYFSSVDDSHEAEKYKLMMEGAKYADQHGFSAVWTPERHFHEFGGIFPNPSVTSAAIAAITRRIAIRAGSVVLPLHNPIRIAEEWSVVDNLSGGRIGMALASGWHADDFAFFPERYEGRKEFFYRNIVTLQQLWKGEAVSVQSGSGRTIEVRIHPKPIQPNLPIWITAAGSADTFSRAGAMGANVLTHLLGQTVEQLAAHLRSYRDSRAKHGHDPDTGQVTLMLHTFIGPDLQTVRDQVRVPFKNYLKSSVDLIANLVRSAGLNLNMEQLTPKDLDDLLSFAFDRYFETSALFGTLRSCEAMVRSLQEVGVTEIGCLIDFGVEASAAMASLSRTTELMGGARSPGLSPRPSGVRSAVPPARAILQCTPSMAGILVSEAGNREFLRGLHTLLLGGEALSSDLADEILKIAPNCSIRNMYGPTETTIWSATHPVPESEHPIPIGRPIANTTIQILDNYGLPVPAGITGEIHIGGDGVARGYVNAPAATSERFLPDPFSLRPGMRLYRTGDLGRYRRDGTIDFLGRNDSQVKVRGFRIELSEIEMALACHPDVRQCVVSLRRAQGAEFLIAHCASEKAAELKADELRKFLRETLPEYMVPSQFVFVGEMPLTTSGKIDRKRLPEIEKTRPLLETRLVPPRDEVEGTVTEIWKQVLRIPELGIDDNFFDLGGHSLLMVQAHQQIQEHFQITVPLIKLLEHPTVRALATYLRGADQAEHSQKAEDRALKGTRAILLQRENAARARMA